MTDWRYKINIAQYLDDEEETPQAVLKTAESIRDEINKLPQAGRLFLNTPYKLVEQTKKAVEAGFDYYEVCNIFNGHLARIYDLADENLVWTSG